MHARLSKTLFFVAVLAPKVRERACTANHSPPFLALLPPFILSPPAASEECLLAALWTLEAFGDIWRGPATTALHDYLQPLHAFSPKVGAALAL